MDLGSIPVSAIGAKHFESDAGRTAILAGGDDYELCFTASPAMGERIESIALALAIPLTPIGTITVDPALTIRDEQGDAMHALPRAFDHFG